MRLLITALLSTLLTGFAAHAEPFVLDAKPGLSAMEAELTAIPARSPSHNLALGATHFLRGIERTLQMRYEQNATLANLEIPVLRLPLPANPDPEPFEPSLILNIFKVVLDEMELSRAALVEIPEDADVALDINILDLWFDTNSNGVRDSWEGALEIGADALVTGRGSPQGMEKHVLTVRFDGADVKWLAAYTHLLSGISELVVAFDPTEAITSVLDSRKVMNEMVDGATPPAFLIPEEEYFVDMFAMIYGAINVKPDAEITRRARQHFLRMIAENRGFWRLVALETDNHNEWIPNDNQNAAMGFTLPENVRARWEAVLSDAENVLNGDLLIPYYWISPVGGVNVKKLFEDPPVVDIVTWIQGAGLLSYLEKGPTVNANNLRMFGQMFTGNAGLFMVLLN